MLAMEQSSPPRIPPLRSVQAALVLIAAPGTAVLIWFFVQQVIRPVRCCMPASGAWERMISGFAFWSR